MAFLGFVIHYVFQVRRGIVPACALLISCPVLCYIPRLCRLFDISFKSTDVYTIALRSDRATLILVGNYDARVCHYFHTNVQPHVYRRAAGVQSINIHISRSRRGAARLIQCFQLGGIINEVLLDQILILNVFEFALTVHIDHAVFQGEGTSTLIDVRAAFVLGGVAPQDRVCQCRTGGYVAHPAAVHIRRVAGEGAVYHRRAAVIVVHPAAVHIRRVAGEGAVYHRRAVAIVVHPSAKTRRIAGEGAVRYRRAGVIVKHPAAITRRVAGKSAVHHLRAGVIVVHTAAVIICRVAGEGAVRHRRV